MPVLKTLPLILLFSLVLINYSPGQVSGSDPNQYAETIKSADSYFQAGDYINAKTSYEYALKLRPEEQYPKIRLEETLLKIRERMNLMEQYNAQTAKGDKLFNERDYDRARLEYQAAGSILPDEKYHQKKLAEIDRAISENARQQGEFDNLIREGDQLMASAKWEEAKTAFEKALLLKPGDQYAQDKITEIGIRLEEQSAREEQYKAIIQAADNFFNQKKYEEAKAEYRKALAIKPGETYPAQKSADIESIMAKRKEFDQVVAAADALYGKREFESAKIKYQEAIKILPGERFPKDMIDKINATLNAQSDKNTLYAKSVAEADKFFSSGDYANARKEYENALSIKPAEAYPSAQIKKIGEMLESARIQQEDYNQVIAQADKHFAGKEYELAKAQYQKALSMRPSESYPADRIKEIDKLLESLKLTLTLYNAAITDADKCFAEKNYKRAIELYQHALSIRPNEQYPHDKITEINKTIEEEKNREANYQKYVAEGDRLFAQKFYDNARQQFENALKLMPGKDYPTTRLAEIDRILGEKKKTDDDYLAAVGAGDEALAARQYDQALASYQQASTIKPGEKYPKDKIIEVEGILASMKTLQGNYDRLIGAADNLFVNADFVQAKAKYEEASKLKPGESYPREKIAEIDRQLNAEKESLEKSYTDAIAEADGYFAAKDYDKARTSYQNALKIKAGEQYPRDRIASIDQLLTDRKALRDSYDKVIAAADNMFVLQDYEASKIKYQEALGIMPGEKYPQDKIGQIEQILDKKNQEELLMKYRKAVADADQYFRAKDYVNAQAGYNAALAIMPGEQYPKDRLDEINRIYQSELKEVQDAYNKAVADADKYYASKVYDQALDSYRQALKHKPGESYPKEMIDKINEFLEESSIVTMVTNSTVLEPNIEKRFPFAPIPVKDRNSDYIILKAQNTGDSGYKLMVNFGKGGTKNGGFIILVPGKDQILDILIRLGQQYKWFTEDNDWIGLIPMGGGLDVSLLKITKGQ
jgi:tetratricopeptide (TPR) repeat protein